MNILLTGVGRRNYLVKYFKDALREINGRVHAMNSTMDTPGMREADVAVQAPLASDQSYEVFLLDYCVQYNIQLIISLFDIEVLKLARLKNRFKDKNIEIVVADETVMEYANDKWRLQDFLRERNFLTQPAFIEWDEWEQAVALNKIKFPVFVKPRCGMGSIGVYRADDPNETLFYWNIAKKEIANSYVKDSTQDQQNAVMIQCALPGHEYGLDVINDLDGNYVTTIVKKKMAMRSGETDVAEVVHEPILEQLGEKLARITKHPANMDVDVFFDGVKAYVLELNPRFGGGYPFSHQAGVNLPLAIIRWSVDRNADLCHLLNAKYGTKAAKGIEMYGWT